MKIMNMNSEEIRDRVIALMMDKSWTLKDLAREAGMNVQTISRFIKEPCSISFNSLLKLVKLIQ